MEDEFFDSVGSIQAKFTQVYNRLRKIEPLGLPHYMIVYEGADCPAKEDYLRYTKEFNKVLADADFSEEWTDQMDKNLEVLENMFQSLGEWWIG